MFRQRRPRCAYVFHDTEVGYSFYMVRPRLNLVLLFVLYAVVLTLLEFTYHYLDFVTRQNPTPWQVPFIEQMTGAFGAVALMPLAVFMARRYRLDTLAWIRNVPPHLVTLV